MNITKWLGCLTQAAQLTRAVGTMNLTKMLEQLAKFSDIAEVRDIEELPIFLTDGDPKVRERAEERLKELKDEHS